MAIYQIKRAWGERLSNTNRWLFSRLGFCIDTADPKGFMRHQYHPYGGPFAACPATPPLGASAHLNIFQFNSAYDINTSNKWIQGNSGSGTPLTVQDERGGVAKFVNGSADNDYYQYISRYEIARASTGKGLWMDGLIKIADADKADWFWGLSAKLSSGNLFDNRVDAVGFYGVSGSTSVSTESRKDSSATQKHNIGSLSDDSWMLLHIYVQGTKRVYFYARLPNETEWNVHIIEANLPDDEELSVAFGCRNGQASANAMTVGRILVIQDL